MALLHSCASAQRILAVCISSAMPILVSAATEFEMMVERAKKNPAALVKLNEYGSFIQAVSGPFSLPGVTSATFQASRGVALGDGDFTRIALPLSYSFERLTFSGMTPYTELTLSYTDQEQNELWMSATSLEMMVRHKVQTASIMSGIGAGFELREGLVIRPIILLGWSRIKDDSQPTTDVGRTFQDAVGRNLSDWTVEQYLFGPAIEVEHKTNIGNDIHVLSGIRATRLHIRTLSTSTPGLEASNQFTSISGNMEIDGPTAISLFERDMRWQTFLAASAFDKDTSRALSFDWLGEAGAGIIFMIRERHTSTVEGIGLKGSAIIGDGIDGWALGLYATF